MSNEGKVLTSTRWNQDGNVYVSVNGIQTQLNEIYNKYCPDLSATNSTKCVTGCTNTADAQIIYYWLEQGYEFDFTISSNDYFYWKTDGKLYYCSSYSQVGEGTISQVNKALNSRNKIANGDFIAALNYYCAVKNHSKYGDSTSSSSVSTGAYKALGFDAYVWKDCDKIYFNSYKDGENTLYELNNVGESIWREAIEYGEVLRVGIPGHAIYMDGYRYNEYLGEYEYHLNYGWGMNNATDWYTVEQMKSKVKVSRFTLDLSPDIKVLVSNTREDYFGGSFTRGMERINNIRNEKTTSFTFDEEIAGGTIMIDSAANITSKVNVDFENFCVTVASTANTAFKSAYAMDFDMDGGAIIVNNSSVSIYAVYETSNKQLCITLDNSYIYSGYDTKGISDIQNMLDISGGYYFEKIADSFLATVKGYSVYAGSADDIIELDDNSAIFGSLSLGGGRNELSISNGSVFYGNYYGTAKSLEVNLSISGSASGAMIVLQSKNAEQNFFNASNGILNVEISNFIKDKEYTLFYSENSAIVDDFTVKLSAYGKNYTLNCNNKQAEDFYLVYDASSISLVYDPSIPEVLSVAASTTAVTCRNVTVSAVFSENAYCKYYSFDNLNWFVLNGNSVEVEQNCTVYFAAANRIGEYSVTKSYEVTNIDKIAPTLEISGNPVEWTNQDVVLSAAVSDGFIEYFDGTNWIGGENMIVAENGTYKFRVTDEAGNVTEKSVTVDKIDKIAPVIGNIRVDKTSLTNTDVIVRADFSDNICLDRQEYRIDDGEWMIYDGKVVMETNGMVYFRAYDLFGHETNAQYEITNIDKIAPTLEISGNPVEWTNQDVVLSAAVSDGFIEYFDGTDWIGGENMIVSENGTYKFRVTDEAGNVTEKSVTVDKIDKVHPVISWNISPDKITNQDVALTASVNEDDCIFLYSFDDYCWFDYSDLSICENIVVYFKTIDKAGNVTKESVSVENIDKTPPEFAVLKFEIPQVMSNTAVPIEMESSDLIQYSTDKITWNFCENVFDILKSGTFYFRAVDEAGNVSEAVAIQVENIDSIADSSAVEYKIVSSKYTRDNTRGKQQNGIDLQWNENAFSAITTVSAKNYNGEKIILLDSKNKLTSSAVIDGALYSSIVAQPVITEKAGSYSYKASANAKGTVEIINNRANADFE
ncbi:MAG: C10 family peptidase, partial [Lentisphaeria bacterium]|nr:C10 family peptidase [Lentisphaeria bacterium]